MFGAGCKMKRRREGGLPSTSAVRRRGLWAFLFAYSPREVYCFFPFPGLFKQGNCRALRHQGANRKRPLEAHLSEGRHTSAHGSAGAASWNRTSLTYRPDAARVERSRDKATKVNVSRNKVQRVGENLVLEAADIRTVQELLGHKTIGMIVGYSHLAPKHMLAVARTWKLDTVLDSEILRTNSVQLPRRVM